MTTFEETREFATVAEQSGLDSIWVFDHLLFRFPPEPDEGPHEAWTTLSALAPVVPRVELGALVLCSSFRPAGVLARMAATLDDLSGGRLILGIGSGWHEPEFLAFGLPFEPRVSWFAEDLEVIARLLRGETVSLADPAPVPTLSRRATLHRRANVHRPTTLRRRSPRTIDAP